MAGAQSEGLLATSLSFGELTRLGRLNCSCRRLHDAAWRAMWRAYSKTEQGRRSRKLRQMNGAAHGRPACLRRGGKVEHAAVLVEKAACA